MKREETLSVQGDNSETHMRYERPREDGMMDGVMVGWPEKKRRAEKQRRNEAKKKEAEKREETRSKPSKSRILILLMGKLSKITKSLIFPSQY